MSLGEWMEGLRARRRVRQIQRHRKHIRNRYGQGEDRQKAVEFFKQLDGQQGASGLLERFMVNVEPTIRDEEEKQSVCDVLIDMGEVVVPAIESYLNRKDSASVPITWPLKVLDAVCQEAVAVDVILRALSEMGTSYTREPERKVVLVAQLAEYDDPRVVPELLPFLRDHRDEVRLEALAALTRRADEAARESMLELLVDESSPMRLRAAVADSLQRLGWSVHGFRKKVEENLPEGFGVDRSGRIKGRWAHAPAVGPADEEG